MKERAIQFGAAGNLTGIVCESSNENTCDRPGVILLNSGILHRIGACRLHVQISRDLAALGFTSLRFDFSGIGDSEARKDSLSFEESAPLEVIEAIEYLTRVKNIHHVVLVGLCSGADAAFHAAARDHRIIGLCQLDAWPYRTWRYYVHHYGPRVRSLAKWRQFLARRLGLAPRARVEVPGDDLVLPTYVREIPPRDLVAARLRELVARGTRLLHIYSGGQEDYNYRAQFVDAFQSVNFRQQLTLAYLPDATHIFSDIAHQRQVVRTIREWTEQFGLQPREKRSSRDLGLAHR